MGPEGGWAHKERAGPEGRRGGDPALAPQCPPWDTRSPGERAVRGRVPAQQASARTDRTGRAGRAPSGQPHSPWGLGPARGSPPHPTAGLRGRGLACLSPALPARSPRHRGGPRAGAQGLRGTPVTGTSMLSSGRTWPRAPRGAGGGASPAVAPGGKGRPSGLPQTLRLTAGQHQPRLCPRAGG